MGDEESEIEEESGAGSAEATGSGDTSKIVKILIYVAGGILAIILMAGISYLISNSVQQSRYEKSQDIVAAPPPAALNTFKLKSFANTTKDAEPHFVKMEISLAYESGNSIPLNNELIKRKDQIRHIINLTLTAKTFENLQGIGGRIALAEEIKAHINSILISGKIKEVYFIELVVN